jgi:RNA polymerase sigma factor (sigma-70 family)
MNEWNDDARTRRSPDGEERPLYESFGEVLLRAVMRIGVPEEAADALVREAFIGYFFLNPPPQPQEAKAWLIAAAGMKASEYLKMHGLPAGGNVAEAARAVEHLEVQREELATLPARAREALRLRVSEGRSYAEIAEALDVSEFAARKMVSRAWAKLRRLRRER